MDKNKQEKNNYDEWLNRSEGEKSTYTFKSTKDTLGKSSDSAIDREEEIDKQNIRPKSKTTKIKDEFGENPYLSGFIAFLGALIIALIVFSWNQAGNIGEIKSNVKGVLKQIDELERDYSMNVDISSEIKYLRDRVKSIEDRLNFGINRN